MSGKNSEEKPRDYSPMTKSLYINLNNPLGLHVNVNNSANTSTEKKRFQNRLSFSSFTNTTCSDIWKLNNYLLLDNNIILLTLNNYSFKLGLINKFDYQLQSVRLPQMEIIEPWKEIGYTSPPYKNYDIIEESIFYSFNNIYKMNLKNKDIFIPFSSNNSISDFTNIGDILFESFQTKSVAFKEPAFVSSLIILLELKMQKTNTLFYKDDKNAHAAKAGGMETPSSNRNSVKSATPKVGMGMGIGIGMEIGMETGTGVGVAKTNIDISQGSTPQKEEFTNDCISHLKNLNFFNFTAILVNIGSTKTTCTPVINGIPLPDLMQIYFIGGYDIDNQIYEEMKKTEKYQKEISMSVAKVAKEKRVFTPKSREECFYLSLLYKQNPKSYLITSFEFRLNYIFESAVNSTEIFFSQYALDTYLKTESYKNLHSNDSNFNFLFIQNTLPEVIHSTILKCPIDYRKELLNNIYITGGTSIIRGFRERLQSELYLLINSQNFYSTATIQVHILKRKLLQKYSIYTGSHLFLELFNYYNYCVTKKEYEECGEHVLAKFSLQGKLIY